MTQLDLIDAFYRAYNSGDAEGAVALYAHDGAHVEAASGKARQGAEDLLKGLRGFLGMLDDLRFDTARPVRAGTQVVVPYVMHGVMTRDLGPMTARGQEIALNGVHIFRIEGGRIMQTMDYWDIADLMGQAA